MAFETIETTPAMTGPEGELFSGQR